MRTSRARTIRGGALRFGLHRGVRGAIVFAACMGAAPLLWAQQSGVGPADTPAQEPAPVDLRREIDALGERVRTLEAQLARSERLIALIEAENNRLRAEIQSLRAQVDSADRAPQDNARPDSGAPGDGGAQADPPPADPRPRLNLDAFDFDSPRSSPIALIGALQGDYRANLGEPQAPRTERERLRLVHDIARWAQLRAPGQEHYSGPFMWLVLIEWITPHDDGDVSIRYTVMDPRTGGPDSLRQFGLRLGAEAAQPLLERNEQDLWLMTGTLEAAPRVNTERVEPGFFDDPPFLGLYAEYATSIEVSGFEPVVPAMPESADASQ